MALIAPKKSLGQNFLRDMNIARKIVALSDIQPEDHVLEIGPGTGALTEIILTQTENLTAIEYDTRAFELLSDKFPNNKYPKFKVINLDIRKFDYWNHSKEVGAKIKVIGNIPYNISSDIIFQILENTDVIQSAVITIQRELAKRIVAQKRTKDYGILTVGRDLVANAKMAFNIPPSAFYPQPAVTSSVLYIEPKEDKVDGAIYRKTMKLVRAAFNNRRKTLRNSLRSHLDSVLNVPIDTFVAYAIANDCDYFKARAEELTTEDFIKLNNLILSYKEK